MNKLPLYTFNIQFMYDNLIFFRFLLWNKLHQYFLTFLLPVSIYIAHMSTTSKCSTTDYIAKTFQRAYKIYIIKSLLRALHFHYAPKAKKTNSKKWYKKPSIYDGRNTLIENNKLLKTMQSIGLHVGTNFMQTVLFIYARRSSYRLSSPHEI